MTDPAPSHGRLPWAALLLGALLCVLQWAGGPDTWGYDRKAIQSGELWRLISAHLVHLNPMHLALNMLGLAGIMAAWGRELHGTRLAVLFAASAAGVSAGLWWLQPELTHYAGASGALHGLFAAGIVLATTLNASFRLLAGLGLLLKLVLETQLGSGTAELIGAPVIHAAHQFGAISGALAALLWQGWTYRERA